MTAESRDPADEDLFARFREGDVDAFEELMRRHRKSLYNFILRWIRHPETSEELLQDTWMRVVQAADDFQGTAKFSTWAYTVARNLCIDHARKQALRGHDSLDHAPTGRGEGATLGEQVKDATARHPDREAIGKEIKLRLIDAIGALPSEQRDVFVLREYSDLPFKEIAAIVGAPENTVKSRMRYALERLQDALAEYEDYARALG